MTLSASAIAALVDEIAPRLDRGVLRRVYAASVDTLVLEVRTPGQNVHLLVSLDPGLGRLHLTGGKPDQPPEPPPFVMLLRKHLVGARVAGLCQVADDRVVRLDLLAWPPDRDEVEDAEPGPVALVFELAGRHANAFLLGPDETVTGAWHPDHSERRPIAPGAVWTPPPPPPTSVPTDDPLALATLPPDGARSAAVEADTDRERQRQQGTLVARALLKRLQSTTATLKRRIAAVEKDLSRAQEAQRFRRWGELLQSAHGKVARGATTARVPDYYADGMPEVDVPLDPALDLEANIAHYFRRYRKFRDAIGPIEDRLLADYDRLDDLHTATIEANDLAFAATFGRVGRIAPLARTDLAAPQALAALLALGDQLQAAGTLPAPRPPAPRRADAAASRDLPYRAFTSKTGKPILVGRGDKHNDALSIKVARGSDLWLHARDLAGAHVIVRLDRHEEVDHETLLDAANLAAHYSRGKTDTLVDVQYTRAKHVRKPKGYPPGMVTVAEGRTIAVRPDPDRIARLFATS